MNYLTRLLLGLGLAIPMSAFAAETPLNWTKSVYLNLGYSATDGMLYLKQKNGDCTIGSVNADGVECVKSVKVTTDLPVSDAFVKVLRMDLGGNKFGFRWKKDPDPALKQSSTLVLSSNLDFHELQNGVCVEDHFAPDFTGTVFDGSGYIISNLCKTIDDQTGSSVGLFKEISNATLKNLSFSNVQFVTSTENPSDLGTKYFPVGALAGKIYNSSVEGVDFENVVIQGPLAGGLAGVIEESSISGFWSFGTGNVVNVSNEIAVTDGYVGECEGCGISYTNGYKALVGGLAGVAYQTSFENINLQLDVQNKADVDLSSVGGLVGLYVYKGNRDNEDYNEFNISRISIKGPNTAKGPVVAGGISMGGLLGEAKRIDSNNFPKSSLIIQDVKIENLEVSRSKFKMTLPKATYLGGLIGYSDLCNSGKLEISNSSVTDFQIIEAVKKNGIYQYYIGGIAGYAGCDHVNNSSSTDLYLTLTKSKATGSINLSAKEPDIASTAEVHVSASMGGLVGAAVIAGNENAVAENEISVGITYDVKKTNTKIAEASEKVYVGGAFGTVNTYNSSAVVKALLTSNYIKVVDDGIESYVGGVVGKFPLISSGDSKISFKDVQVGPRNSKKSILLDYEAFGTPGYDSYASVGGLCGDCSLIGEIVQSSVKGHFNKLDGNGSFEKKTFSLGGLVGKSRASEPIIVKNTYSNGNISDKFAVEKAPKNKVGYLFGEIPGIQGQKESILISNFHYGEDNVAAIGDADASSVKNFTEGNFGEFTATNNVRNGAKTELTAKNNGYVSKDYMESSNFAAFLNSPWTESEDIVWAYSNEAGGLPFFGTPELIVSTVPVVFKDGDAVLSVKIGDKVVDVQNVKVGGAAVAPADPAPKNGQCFDKWNKDYTRVMEAMEVLAQYKKCEYTVKFYALDKVNVISTQKVTAGEAATAPENNPEPYEGQCFVRWKEAFDAVVNDMTIYPVSAPCEYEVTFIGLDKNGEKSSKKQQVVHGGNAALPTSEDFPAEVSGQCFDSWDGYYTNVTEERTITAQYVTCKYTVKFTDEEGSKTYKTQEVEYGKDAVAPTELDLPEGKCFDRWQGSFANVTADATIKAKTKSCESSSSSNTSSSNSNSSSSSSENVVSSSSSSAGNGGSNPGAGKSSSSVGNGTGKSSSSGWRIYHEGLNYQYLYEIVEPKAKQDSTALYIEFDKEKLAEVSEKVDCHIQVISDVGVYLDTVIDASAIENTKNGKWRLDPAPVGDYTVSFKLTDGDNSVRYETDFSKPKIMNYVLHSWQMLSLYAFCQSKGEECLSGLQARFARSQNDWAIRQCEDMKAEVRRGNAPDDDEFYREMEEACAQASGMSAVASVYWWDETNPVGDFWQYRKFNMNDKFDSTRGYWYGTMERDPLVMSLQTPNMDDEVVWHLENKYSGWNLVANPYGWYINLPKENGLEFCRWDAESGDCDGDSGILGPYEAIWVHTEKPMTYRIPLKASIVLEDENKPLTKSAADENWNLRVVLSDDNGKRDSWNELAAGRLGKSLGEPPAGMGDRVNLSIVEGKKRLAKSVKQSRDDMEWDLEVSATTSRDGHLSFDGLERVWAKGMRVYATIDNETVEVEKDRALDVKLSSKSKNVSIRVTKSANPVFVAKNLIKGFRLGQTTDVLNVGFEAASKLAGANVKVSIVGVDGRIVATNRAIAREGSNAISMKKPKQGVYFVKVKVGSQSAVTRVMVR